MSGAASAILGSPPVIGTPIQLGSHAHASGGGTTNVITTGVNGPAGNLFVSINGNGTGATNLTGVVDSASNSYTGLSQQGDFHVGPCSARAFYALNSALLSSGDTATTTYADTYSQYGFLVAISGILTSGALDVDAGGNTFNSSAPSISTGVLAKANEIIIGYVFVSGGASDTFTEAPGFTTGGRLDLASGSSLHWAYKIVSSTASVTYAPVLGTLRDGAMNAMSFKGN